MQRCSYFQETRIGSNTTGSRWCWQCSCNSRYTGHISQHHRLQNVEQGALFFFLIYKNRDRNLPVSSKVKATSNSVSAINHSSVKTFAVSFGVSSVDCQIASLVFNVPERDAMERFPSASTAVEARPENKTAVPRRKTDVSGFSLFVWQLTNKRKTTLNRNQREKAGLSFVITSLTRTLTCKKLCVGASVSRVLALGDVYN